MKFAFCLFCEVRNFRMRRISVSATPTEQQPEGRPCDRRCWRAIKGWISNRGEEPGPLFWPILKNGRPIRRRISDQTIYDVLRCLRKPTGSRGFSPHVFTRTFVSDLITARGDIWSPKNLPGTPETTARYDRRGEEAKKEAAEGLHVPYRALGQIGTWPSCTGFSAQPRIHTSYPLGVSQIPP